jgi:hypothetical protein
MAEGHIVSTTCSPTSIGKSRVMIRLEMVHAVGWVCGIWLTSSGGEGTHGTWKVNGYADESPARRSD